MKNKRLFRTPAFRAARRRGCIDIEPAPVPGAKT
jgi:hypothetical protein